MHDKDHPIKTFRVSLRLPGQTSNVVLRPFNFDTDQVISDDGKVDPCAAKTDLHFLNEQSPRAASHQTWEL
jgi:hypothetical protein